MNAIKKFKKEIIGHMIDSAKGLKELFPKPKKTPDVYISEGGNLEIKPFQGGFENEFNDYAITINLKDLEKWLEEEFDYGYIEDFRSFAKSIDSLNLALTKAIQKIEYDRQ